MVVKRIVYVRLVFQLSSAVNERGFSRLKLIKTYLRNRMSDELLDWLMLISIEGPELDNKEAVDNLCERALIRWRALKQRVPQRGNPGHTRKRQKTDEDEEPLKEFLASANERPPPAASIPSADEITPPPHTPAPGESVIESYGAVPSDLKGLEIAHHFDEYGWCRGKVSGR